MKRVWAPPIAFILAATSAGAYVPADPKAPPEPVAVTESSNDERAEHRDVREFERLLIELDAEDRALSDQLRAIGPQIEMVKRRMTARGRAYYRLVKAGLLPVGGGFESLVNHATRVEQLRAALIGDVDATRLLKQTSTSIERKLRLVRAERAPLAAQRQAFLRAKTAMKQAEERRAAFERAFGGGANEDHVAIYGAEHGLESSRPAQPFSELRGRLSFPLAGRAEVLADSRNGKRGLTLRATGKAAVRAVYAGRVTFAGSTEHGKTVVIEHGSGFFSMYGQMQRVDVRVGERVQEQTPIGAVSPRGQQPSELYFELRREQRILDAAVWLGL